MQGLLKLSRWSNKLASFTLHYTVAVSRVYKRTVLINTSLYFGVEFVAAN